MFLQDVLQFAPGLFMHTDTGIAKQEIMKSL